MTHSHVLNKRKLLGQFGRYVVPTILAMVSSGLYQLIDGVFIGQFVGAEGLAGINIAWPVVGLLYALGMLIGVGAGSLGSIARGRSDMGEAGRVLGNGLLLVVLAGGLCAAALLFAGEFFISAQQATGQVKQYALNYLNVVIYGAPATVGAMALPFMVRNNAAPNRATMLIVAGAVINIVLDALFVVGFGWELRGVATATVISQAIVTLLGIGFFVSNGSQVRLKAASFRLGFTRCRKIAVVGFSSFFMYMYQGFVVAIHNWFLLSYGGPAEVGAYSIVNYLMVFYFMLAEGVANGAQPLISYNCGANRFDAVRQLTKWMFYGTMGSGVLIVLFVNIAAAPVIHVFNNSDKALFDATENALRLHMLTIYLDGFLFSVSVFFQSIGQGAKASWISIGNMLIQVPFLALLPWLLGLNGVWLAMPLSNIALAIVVLFIFYKGWKALPQSLVTMGAASGLRSAA